MASLKRVIVTAKLWVRDGRFEAFAAFEEKAFVIMARHGAKVLRVDQNHSASDGSAHEVHVLEFPDMDSFDAYRSDPALVALADQREACIAKTEVAFT